MKEPMPVWDTVVDFMEGLSISAERMPVVRTARGDRRLPDWLRNAVLKRDRFLCRWCGYRSDGLLLHIDHIVPWSAGGTNESTNLRVLCEDCNETRSNTYTDARSARSMPISHACHNCEHTRPADEPHAHAFCLQCSRTTQVPAVLIERALAEQRSTDA